MSIADRMKKIRGLMTQKDFAEKIGLTSQAILNYERHGRTPKKAVVSKLCEIFGVSEDWLLTGEGPMYKNNVINGVDNEKIADLSGILDEKNQQQHEIIKYEKNKIADMSAILEVQQENASLQRELRELMRENATILRENGDLRVNAERQKYRIAELERELVRVLKGDEAEDMASAG